ncbi:Major facilitator superfamily transporter [Purpureocillium lavendulum]|uniref:Major facilitator superfamily transporter n=1 Tax=Purpureocillium lavendulum TaxID=1247861 RepID=A0AB34FXB3_9HYPO|nr:Major facilitator superfamily transporter [Purpureocillium lavendulum]
MATASSNMIDVRKMRYTGPAMAAFKAFSTCSHEHLDGSCERPDDGEKASSAGTITRPWSTTEYDREPAEIPSSGRNLGSYPLTSELSPWVRTAITKYVPDEQTTQLVQPFAARFHDLIEKERQSGSGLHDLDLIELSYQLTLEVGTALLLAADKTDCPVDIQNEYHSSKAANDEHFIAWGKLLTGLDCDPPIIVLFPFYLMMCQAFTLEPNTQQADYVYSALTGVDWAKGKDEFNERLKAFEKLARSSVPELDDVRSGQDRSFWRITQGYVRAMNDCENSRTFKAPRKARIDHDLDHDLLIAVRGLDTIGSAYMCSDGASWFDNSGIDSLIGSGLANDVMDLDIDIKTGETRNLLRLLYPDGMTLKESMQTVSTILSGQLCEFFRGHRRARFDGREDGRVAATSPAYSFCRSRHRRIFATLERYTSRYPDFWQWTWEILRMAKEQVTESGLAEPLVCSLKRAVTRQSLPDAPRSKFYDAFYELIEDGTTQMQVSKPLGVSTDLAPMLREVHTLWHEKLLSATEPGWGNDFDVQSDALLGEAGEILANRDAPKADMYKFAIAWGRMSMTLPFVAYHTVDAIIMAFGVAA